MRARDPFFCGVVRTFDLVAATKLTNPGEAPMNNTSFFTADRATHLKIVVVSLLASIAVMVVGIAARPQATDETKQATVYKPAKPIMATSDTARTVR